MSRRPRRNHSPALRAKVPLAAVKGEKTLAELVQQDAARHASAGRHQDRPSARRHADGADGDRVDLLPSEHVQASAGAGSALGHAPGMAVA